MSPSINGCQHANFEDRCGFQEDTGTWIGVVESLVSPVDNRIKSAWVAQLCLKTFRESFPYTSDALKHLAVMSRGNFRNFLRYVTQTLDSWGLLPEPKGLIDLALVQRTITTDQLVEAMEVQLGSVFPKGSDLRLQAVRLLMFLEESGPYRQTKLATELGMEPYAMSRLLKTLEEHRIIIRRREGTDKIVSLWKKEE